MRSYGDFMALHRSMSARRRRWLTALCVIIVAGLAAGLYWFQPWRLWTNVEVQEALPVVAADTRVAAPTATAPVAPATTATPPDGRSTVATTPRSAVAATSPTPSPSTAQPGRSATAAQPRSERAGSAIVAPSTSTSIIRPTAARPSAPSVATVLAAGTLISHEHDTSGIARIVKLADGRRVLTLENLRTSDGPALHVWLTDAPVLDGEDGWKVFDDGLYADLGNLKGNIGNQVYPLPADLDLSRYSSVAIWCERFSVSFGAAELENT